MATTGIHFWSTTAATNATADSSVNWAEGQAPSSVNDSARALMASASKTYKDIAGTLTTGGSSTAYTVTTNQVFPDAATMSGALITFIPHTTSGATPTLAVDGLTARQIRTATGTNVATGALIAGTPYTVTYIHASTEFILHQGLGVLGALSTSSLVVTGTASVGGATTLSSTLAVTGNTTLTGRLTIPDGTAASPAIRQTAGSSDCGMYFIADDQIGLACAGLNVATITASTLTHVGAINGATAAGSMIASQAEQETGTAVDKLVSSGRQHFHLSACKCFGLTTGGTSPALHANSYNMTSITDNSAGNLTVTIATDFSSANWSGAVGITTATGDAMLGIMVSKAAGSVVIEAYDEIDAGAANDPGVGIDWLFFGDQA